MPKKKTKPIREPRELPRRLLQGLEEAQELIEGQDWGPAYERLAELDERWPDTPPVMALLTQVCAELRDWQGFQKAVEGLLRHAPDDADLRLALIDAYRANQYPVHAWQALGEFIERYPAHEMIDEARSRQQSLAPDVERLLAAQRLSRDEIKLALDLERMAMLLGEAQFRQAILLGESLVARRLDFTPVYYLLCEACWMSNQNEKALGWAVKLLQDKPEDVQALAYAGRFSLLDGQAPAAQEYARRLKEAPLEFPGDLPNMAAELALRKMELFSLLEQDTVVLETYQQAQAAGALEGERTQAAMLCHLAAAAYVWQGDLEAARHLWQQALEYSPEFEAVQENLADLEKPPAERNGPYAFPFHEWLSPRALEDLGPVMKAMAGKQEAAVQHSVRRWVEKHPEVIALAAFMLRRSDDTARRMLLIVVERLEQRELYEPAKAFVLGQPGADELRLAAANVLASAGVFSTGMQRMWLNGNWTEMLLMGINLAPDDWQGHSPRVEKWLRTALKLSRQGEHRQAEVLLKQALQNEADSPDLLYNLAAVYQYQGRFDEADALVEQVHERFPDYLFARTGLAQVCINRGDLPRARQLLQPLLERRRMGLSEFDAFCAAHVDLYLAEGDAKLAGAWFGAWESTNPENPKLALYRGKVGA